MKAVVKILQIESLTHDVKRFVLEKPAGYKFNPGQATDISINEGKYKKELRPFTFTSLNEDPFIEFIIKSYPVAEYPNHQGFTEKLHTLNPGDELIIRSPWGAIKYKGSGVFIAGGAGITPFIAILRQLNKTKEINSSTLIFSNKTAGDIILEKELRAIFTKQGKLFLTLTREKKAGYEEGRVDGDFIKKRIRDFSQKFYLCGPRELVSNINKALANFGVKSNSLIFEQ